MHIERFRGDSETLVAKTHHTLCYVFSKVFALIVSLALLLSEANSLTKTNTENSSTTYCYVLTAFCSVQILHLLLDIVLQMMFLFLPGSNIQRTEMGNSFSCQRSTFICLVEFSSGFPLVLDSFCVA